MSATMIMRPAQDSTTEWLTPPWILQALGPFDLDPCAPATRPWDTAGRHYAIQDDGLTRPWTGRVWLNPPYGRQTGRWLDRMTRHGDGIALVFARCDTEMFHESVFPVAHGLLFLRGRVRFHRVDGREARDNGGAASVLIAYGTQNAGRLAESGLPGHYIPLRGTS